MKTALLLSLSLVSLAPRATAVLPLDPPVLSPLAIEGEDESETTFYNQLDIAAPHPLLDTSLEIRLSAPDQQVLEFEVQAEPLPLGIFPGSLYLPETPLGQGYLIRDEDQPLGDYMLLFEHGELAIPLSWDSLLIGSSGVQGNVLAEVSHVPVERYCGPYPKRSFQLGAPEICIERQSDDAGTKGILIYVLGPADCKYRFIQFVSVTMSWKGCNADGSPAQGTGAGPQSNKANGGAPMSTDGTQVYVDAGAGDGSYPHQSREHADPSEPVAQQEMTDAPGITNPKKIIDDIEAANPGVVVKEFTLTQHFTTYLLEHCGISVEIPIAKIEWCRTQTVPVNDDNTTPAPPDGGWGGPGAAPIPANGFDNGKPMVTPVGFFDSEHNTALGNHMSGAYTGAPRAGW